MLMLQVLVLQRENMSDTCLLPLSDGEIIRRALAGILLLYNMKNNQSPPQQSSPLKIIHKISTPILPDYTIQPRSVSQLRALIKLRKQQARTEMIPQIGSTREQLVKNGINVQQIASYVADIQKQIIVHKPKKEAQSYFHVNLNTQPLEEYLSKAEEYASMGIMQSIMSKPSHRRAAINRLVHSVVQQNRTLTTWQCEITLQNQSSYIEIIKDIVREEDQPINISQRILKQFKLRSMTAQNNSLWEILHYQLSNYNSSDTLPTNMTRMLISSLKLIQLEFQRKIHGKDFDRFVNHYYLSRINSNCFEKKYSLWPKIWLAYCTNQKNRVNDLLSSDTRNHIELMRIYELSEQCVRNGKPIKQSFAPQYDIRDIFYEQFIYTVTGQPRYSHAFFSDATSLQLLLIVVSTLGIYYQTEKIKFEDVRSKIVNNYRAIGAQDDMIRNILYLMDYTSLVEMGANALMSKQDYLHYLILMVGYPDLVPPNTLKTQLIKHLVSYITELITSKRNQYIYYIKLLPEDVRSEQTSSIIISVDAFHTFDWKALEQLLEERKYRNIVIATVDKYRLKSGVELEAAIKLQQLCKDEKRAYDCLLTLFINHYLQKTKYPREVVIKAEQTGLDWTSQDGFMAIQEYGFIQRNTGYRVLFNFIAAINKLYNYIISRNSQMLREFIASCEFVILKLDSPYSPYIQMLRILDENSGLELYFFFLKLVVKGAEIYSVRIGDSQKLQILKSALLEQVVRIKNYPWRRKTYEQSQLIKLQEELSSSNVYFGHP